MIIKLKGADFSANNINSLLNSWPIMFYGRTLVTGTFVSSVSKGSTYTATFSVADKCTIDSVVITRGGTTMSGATISGNTITISVPTTTESGPISITFNGSKENGDDPVIPITLDSIAYDGKTYRDIFITNNLAPNINNNVMLSNASENITYKQQGTLSISNISTPEDNYVPPYAIHIDNSSANLATTSASVSGDTNYFAASNIKASQCSNGIFGIILGDKQVGITAPNNKYEVVCDIGVSSQLTSSNKFSLYVGSSRLGTESATITGYINNPVVIPMSIFGTSTPSLDELKTLYQNYNNILIAA